MSVWRSPVAVGGGYGGTTVPPEITIFIPSATVIPSSTTCSRCTRIKKPLVGFGVVGTNTLITVPWVLACASPSVSFVTKPIEYTPARGNSTNTTRWNIVLRPDNSVWLISFMKPYVLFNSGTRVMIASPADTILLPTTRRVTQPTNVVKTMNANNAMIRYNGVNICVRSDSGSMKSVTHVNRPTRISTDAATGTTTNKPAKNEFRMTFPRLGHAGYRNRFTPNRTRETPPVRSRESPTQIPR